MNTRELRVGNWVMSYDNPNEEPEYSEVISVGRGWASLSESNSYKIDEDWIEPIQLTPELFKGIGFNIKYKDHPTLYAEKCMVVEFDGFELEMLYEDNNVFMFDVRMYFIPIEYLHQLQNLYFAITGEELSVEL